MPEKLDQELNRLRVTGAMKRAITRAAQQSGINEAAWRKLVIATALTSQLGQSWREEKCDDQETVLVGDDPSVGVDTDHLDS